jgi:hypothetical protein
MAIFFLQWLYDHRYPWDHRVFEEAAKGGHVTICQVFKYDCFGKLISNHF